jgi:hypothetical protein
VIKVRVVQQFTGAITTSRPKPLAIMVLPKTDLARMLANPQQVAKSNEPLNMLGL